MVIKVWEFVVTDNMIDHLSGHDMSLFFNSLEDSIQEICAKYEVEPWEAKHVD